MSLSFSDFVGLADTAYKDLTLNAFINVNDKSFQVVEPSTGNASGYVGYVLYDATDKDVIVINRGTETAEDVLVDAAMATADGPYSGRQQALWRDGHRRLRRQRKSLVDTDKIG